MRRLPFLFILAFILPNYLLAQCGGTDFFDKCASLASQFTFVKSLNIEPTMFKPENKELKFSYLFSKGSTYMITVCDKPTAGNKLKVDLYDRQHKLVASSYSKATNRYYTKMVFACRTSGVYYLEYSFLNETPTCGLSIIALQKYIKRSQ